MVTSSRLPGFYKLSPSERLSTVSQATGLDSGQLAAVVPADDKMLAIAEMQGDLCAACHVRLRPAITQQVRRGTDLVACDSCQRILFAKPAPATDAATTAAPA